MLSRRLVSLLSLVVAASAASQIHNANPSFNKDHRAQACVSAKENANGAPVTIEDCSKNGDNANFKWDLTFFFESLKAPVPQQIKVFGDKCLEVNNANGAPVQISTCNASPNQQWTSHTDSSFRWGGDLKQCLDTRDGKLAVGAPLVIRPCTNSWSDTQVWSNRAIDHRIEHLYLEANGGTFCMTGSSNRVGAQVGLAKCVNRDADFKETYPEGSIKWLVPPIGFTDQLWVLNNKCLTVPGNKKENGVKLVLEDCPKQWSTSNQHQRFTSLPGGQLQLEGTNFCVDRDPTNAEAKSGNLVQLWECQPTPTTQKWSRLGWLKGVP